MGRVRIRVYSEILKQSRDKGGGGEVDCMFMYTFIPDIKLLRISLLCAYQRKFLREIPFFHQFPLQYLVVNSHDFNDHNYSSD